MSFGSPGRLDDALAQDPRLAAVARRLPAAAGTVDRPVAERAARVAANAAVRRALRRAVRDMARRLRILDAGTARDLPPRRSFRERDGASRLRA
jgi:hypothetical protein